MDICFDGVGQVAATFAVSGQVEPGMAVALTDNGTVGLGKDGSALCGVALGHVRNGAAAVQIGGAAKVAFSGTAPKAGWQELVCDGTGGVRAAAGGESKTAADGVKCLVMAVDEDGKAAVIKL